MNEGKKDRRDPIRTVKPRNFVAKNATTGGAGAHKDKKKAMKQGDTKHKKKEPTYESVLAAKLKESSNELAQQMMAMAKGMGMNPRLRGTPDEERARTDAMLKQRAIDRANAPKPAGPNPEERAELEAKLARLEAELAKDPDYEYSDDHRVWRKGHNLKMSIMGIKRQLAQGIEESVRRGEYILWDVTFDDGTTAKIRVPSDEITTPEIKAHYAKQGKTVVKATTDWSIHGGEFTPDPRQSALDKQYAQQRDLDRALSAQDRKLPEYQDRMAGVGMGNYVIDNESIDYGWTTESLAKHLFDCENTYEDRLQNQLNKKLGK